MWAHRAFQFVDYKYGYREAWRETRYNTFTRARTHSCGELHSLPFEKEFFLEKRGINLHKKY